MQKSRTWICGEKKVGIEFSNKVSPYFGGMGWGAWMDKWSSPKRRPVEGGLHQQGPINKQNGRNGERVPNILKLTLHKNKYNFF